MPITDGIPLLHLTVQPAFQPFSGGESGTYYLMASQTQKQVFFDKEDTGLNIWKMSEPLTDPSMTCSVLKLDPFSGLSGSSPPVNGVRQPGSDARVDPVGDWLMNLDYNDGSL